MSTVYISIGNSDDKLSQSEWSSFYAITDSTIRRWADAIHGAWLSIPSDPWQNACWCAEIPEDAAQSLVDELASLTRAFRQDSIAWAEAKTQFISAPGRGGAR